MKRILIASMALLAVSVSYSGSAKHAGSCKLKVGSNTVTADAAAGKLVYLRCGACHTLDQGGRNMVGPNLGQMFNGKALTAPKYRYSSAFEKAAPKWNNLAKLDEFLRKPTNAVPGTKMIFAGLPKAQDRANLIAYLKKETTDSSCR